MKGKRNVHSKKNRLRRGMMYGGFTVLLTCVIVTAYYLISNGVIFGKYVADEPYIAQKYIDNYVEGIKGNAAKYDKKEFERVYRYSTLPYFHDELGLNADNIEKRKETA